MKYAKTTSVSVDRSKAELEWLLSRYGATEFAYATNQKKAMIGFVMNGRKVQMSLPLPDPNRFARSESGRERSKEQAMQHWEQACRSLWRSLVLIVKAKLEGIEAGIVSMDEEFLAYTALPNGRTIGDVLAPQIQSIVDSGKVTPLLSIGEV
jgi:hypothetical protein